MIQRTGGAKNATAEARSKAGTKMKKAWWLGLPLTFLLASTPAWAQETGGQAGAEVEVHAAEEEHESPYAVVFRWMNFLILYGGLGYLLREPAAEFFESRRQSIQGGLERAEKAQADSSKKLAEIETRLAQLSSEADRICSEAKESAENERERIVAEAKMEADRILEQSRQEIQRLARGFQQEIRAHVADLVVARAETRLRSETSEADQKQSVLRFVRNLK